MKLSAGYAGPILCTENMHFGDIVRFEREHHAKGEGVSGDF